MKAGTTNLEGTLGYFRELGALVHIVLGALKLFFFPGYAHKWNVVRMV